MDQLNRTHVTMFVFSGLTDNEELAPFLFAMLLPVYLACANLNLGMIFMVLKASNLQSPMYYFLCCLSFVDLFFSSVIAPKMLADLLSESKFILFTGCAAQFFFFDALVVTESVLLSAMSYDRYVAIRHPLSYFSIMTIKMCLDLVLVSFFIGFFQSIVQTSCIFSLTFCGPNLIDHFYCDAPPLIKLSCSSSFQCKAITVFFVSVVGGGCLVAIAVSYAFIASCILRIKSSTGRQKAFRTCSSHLTCVSIFYGTVFFLYLRSSDSSLERQDKAASLLYTVILPMLNPLIYSLRNQEVKLVIRRTFLNINKGLLQL
ncbi:olfactory receptor 5AR1-like [Gastrophryne carolinensis]